MVVNPSQNPFAAYYSMLSGMSISKLQEIGGNQIAGHGRADAVSALVTGAQPTFHTQPQHVAPTALIPSSLGIQSSLANISPSQLEAILANFSSNLHQHNIQRHLQTSLPLPSSPESAASLQPPMQTATPSLLLDVLQQSQTHPLLRQQQIVSKLDATSGGGLAQSFVKNTTNAMLASNLQALKELAPKGTSTSSTESVNLEATPPISKQSKYQFRYLPQEIDFLEYIFSVRQHNLPRFVRDFRAIADKFNQNEIRVRSNSLVQPSQIQNWFKNRLQKEKRIVNASARENGRPKSGEWLTIPTGFRFFHKERMFLEHIYRTRNRATPKGTECEAIVDAFNTVEPRLSAAGMIQKKQIQQWFMNRRKRDKKEMMQQASEEELRSLNTASGAAQTPTLGAEDYAAWKSIQEGRTTDHAHNRTSSDLSQLLNDYFRRPNSRSPVRILGQVLKEEKSNAPNDSH